MTFGSSPCLSSDWGHEYFRKIKTFFEKTGMKCFEHDGSYPGDVCASTTHTYHKGLNDSQWNQFQTVTALYHRRVWQTVVYHRIAVDILQLFIRLFTRFVFLCGR